MELQVKELTKYYGKTLALDHLSMILLVCVLSAVVIAVGCMYTTWKWEK
ncbi:MAG: hypothetical protein SO015_09070 [Wujia sp.]|nr:hypothetical protein [Wujia sp.]MDY3728288.1 hypothetical protein [Wujia sp.]